LLRFELPAYGFTVLPVIRACAVEARDRLRGAVRIVCGAGPLHALPGQLLGCEALGSDALERDVRDPA